MAWFTSTLVRDVIDDHAPIWKKTIKSESVSYTNSRLRKAQYKRNMTRKKFKIYGKSYWEKATGTGIMLSKWKKNISLRIVRTMIKLSGPPHPHLLLTKNNVKKNILLRNKDEAVLDPKCISELFIDYFSSVANVIGFDDNVESAKDAIMKHSTHPSTSEIKRYNIWVSKSQ